MSQPAATPAARRIEALRSKNLCLALVLASIALAFFAGFVAKIVLFSHA